MFFSSSSYFFVFFLNALPVEVALPDTFHARRTCRNALVAVQQILRVSATCASFHHEGALQAGPDCSTACGCRVDHTRGPVALSRPAARRNAFLTKSPCSRDGVRRRAALYTPTTKQQRAAFADGADRRCVVRREMQGLGMFGVLVRRLRLRSVSGHYHLFLSRYASMAVSNTARIPRCNAGAAEVARSFRYQGAVA